MPKVSVIIPTYNRAEFLRLAIVSVLGQTFQDFEIIVVDDASGDNTPEVVGGFDDARIRYLRHEINKDGSAARNTGIKMSNGEYIALLDDDDEWLPEKLEMQVKLLDASPPKVGGVYTGFLKVDRTTEKVLGLSVPSKRGDLIDELIIENRIGTASTILLRKECFEKVGLFDEELPSSQDYDMWIRIARIYDLECIKNPLIRYSIHENKITTNPRRNVIGMEIMLDRYGSLFKLNKKSYSYRYLSLGVFYCYDNNTEKARKAFLKAIKLYPFELRSYFNLCLSLLGAESFKKIKEIKKSLIFPRRNNSFDYGANQ